MSFMDGLSVSQSTSSLSVLGIGIFVGVVRCIGYRPIALGLLLI